MLLNGSEMLLGNEYISLFDTTPPIFPYVVSFDGDTLVAFRLYVRVVAFGECLSLKDEDHGSNILRGKL